MHTGGHLDRVQAVCAGAARAPGGRAPAESRGNRLRGGFHCAGSAGGVQVTGTCFTAALYDVLLLSSSLANLQLRGGGCVPLRVVLEKKKKYFNTCSCRFFFVALKLLLRARFIVGIIFIQQHILTVGSIVAQQQC